MIHAFLMITKTEDDKHSEDRFHGVNFTLKVFSQTAIEFTFK